MPQTRSTPAETRFSLGAVAAVVLGLVFAIGLVAASMAVTWPESGSPGTVWPDVGLAAKASELKLLK